MKHGILVDKHRIGSVPGIYRLTEPYLDVRYDGEYERDVDHVAVLYEVHNGRPVTRLYACSSEARIMVNHEITEARVDGSFSVMAALNKIGYGVEVDL